MSLRLDQTTVQTAKKGIALKVHNQYPTHFPSVYDTSEINFNAILSIWLKLLITAKWFLVDCYICLISSNEAGSFKMQISRKTGRGLVSKSGHFLLE